MSGKVGEPFVASGDRFLMGSGQENVCVTGADVTFDFAGLQAALVADGAAFSDGSLYDDTNPDHEIVSASIQSYYCGDDPCKDGELVTAVGVCHIDGGGDVMAVAQGGMQLWEGSENSGPISAASQFVVPAGSAALICYTIRDTSTLIK